MALVPTIVEGLRVGEGQEEAVSEADVVHANRDASRRVGRARRGGWNPMLVEVLGDARQGQPARALSHDQALDLGWDT